jgi:hypothetical protein
MWALQYIKSCYALVTALCFSWKSQPVTLYTGEILHYISSSYTFIKTKAYW